MAFEQIGRGAEGHEPGSQLPGEPKSTEAGSVSRRSFLKGGAAVAASLAATPLLTRNQASGMSLSSRATRAHASSQELEFLNFYAPSKAQPPLQVKWFENLVAEWNRTHTPKIRLSYLPSATYMNGPNVYSQFASGHGPDVFLLSPGDFARYYNGGVLVDLSQYMTPAARADYFPSVMATREVNGHIYGLPMEVEPMAFFYSIDAFEKAHLSEADLPRTWTQLLDVAHKLSTPRRFGLAFETTPGYYQNFTWYPFLWETDSFIVDRNQKTSGFRSKGAQEALALWRESVSRNVAPRKVGGQGGFDVIGNLASGLCAIQNVGIWAVSALRQEAPKFRYGVFKLPVPPGGHYGTVLGGWAFVANAKSPNAEAAAKFCVWALGTTDPACIQRGYDWIGVAKSDLAPRQSVLALADKHGTYASGAMKIFREEIFPGGRGEPRLPPPVYQAVSTAIQSAQLGSGSISQIADTAASTIEGYLAGYTGCSVSDQAEAPTVLTTKK